MSRTFSWSAVLLILLLITGCRTYGDDGAEEATYAQMERVLERFEADLSRAKGDLSQLEAQAGDPVLSVVAAQYAQLIAAHEAVLEEQKEIAAELSPDSDYRSLHRAYGALVTEQQLLRQQYQGVLRHVYDAYEADTSGTEAVEDRPYALIPPYYGTVSAGAQPVTVNDVVSRAGSGSMPREGFRMLMPAMEADHGGHGSDDAHGDGGH